MKMKNYDKNPPCSSSLRISVAFHFAFHFDIMWLVAIMTLVELGLASSFSFTNAPCWESSPLSFRGQYTRCSDTFEGKSSGMIDSDDDVPQSRAHPIPTMPSPLFQKMAQSQLELLANSILQQDDSQQQMKPASKIESMALYLPQENTKTGQLEFIPSVIYPDPKSERIFIARDAASGVAPELPRALTALPGFAHATTLLPGYPMITTGENTPGAGVVEEVLCDPLSRNRAAALSVPLLSGSQTVGVLLVSPTAVTSTTQAKNGVNVWTEFDRQQVSRAAQSLSMALVMDLERSAMQQQNTKVRQALSDSLHQVKNPVQALRTYGKLLQRRIARTELDEKSGDGRQPYAGDTPHILELVDNLMSQSERVVDLLVPMDSIVDTLEDSSSGRASLLLNPAAPNTNDMVLWRDKSPNSKRPEPHSETAPLEFSRQNESTTGKLTSYSSRSDSNDRAKSSVRRHPRDALSLLEKESTGPSRLQEEHTTVVGDMEMEMTFVVEILEPIMTAFRAIAYERGIEFDVAEMPDELPGVWASPKSLQEAVSNILDNACKYVTLSHSEEVQNTTYQQQPPKVRVRFLANDVKNQPPGVTILVEDNGPGIAEHERENVFERGYRSSSTYGIDGSGIGLAIGRTLIQRMGGILEVANPNEFKDTLGGAVLKLVLFRNP